ncbi:hypothetical protein GH5_01657 [Leishmania sp. Ghana 2012 LV757]|uniref:hypothetical protein n=1 Tax=Leishmania sp. Ghana 2012 LV757 TaxID=2803181 RepID=UPI001B444AC9|nr:hypothetical protein GH5_01657 [Leishmania sp. Ghana 2012 LV757]
MGFGLCQPKPASVAESKTAPRVKQPDMVAVPAKSTTSASAYKILPLVEVCDEVGTRQLPTAIPFPRSAKGAGEGSYSVSRSTMLDDCGSPLWAPGTRVFAGRDDSKLPSSLLDLGAAATDTTLSLSLRRGPDVANGTRTYPSAAPNGEASPFCPWAFSAGKSDCFSATDAPTAAHGVVSRTRRASGPVDACRVNSILRPNSRWADSYLPLTENLPLSMEHRSMSLCSGPLPTLTPCRGSVRFLGSGEKNAESTEVALHESMKQGVEDRRKETSSGGRTFAGTPTPQGSRRHVPHSLIAENAGAESESLKRKVDATLCSPVRTASSVSRETPSPWPSVDDSASGPSHHHGVFDSLTPFCFGDNNYQLGVSYGDGGSGETLPVAGLPPISAGAFQSRRSILLRPNANTSGVGGSSAPQAAVSPLWQDSKSAGPRRASRRWQSEQEGFFSERRPSFTLALPRRSSGFKQHRLSRSEDSSSDDEHMIASVRCAMMRLQRSDGANSKCNSVPGRREDRLSSADIRARALRTAAKMGDAMLPALSATTKTDSSLPISSSATSESSCAGAVSRAQASEPCRKSPT